MKVERIAPESGDARVGAGMIPTVCTAGKGVKVKENADTVSTGSIDEGLDILPAIYIDVGNGLEGSGLAEGRAKGEIANGDADGST